MRTASARSPTNAKLNIGGISDAEQEQIRKVLARAEAGKQSEQQRIGLVFFIQIGMITIFICQLTKKVQK